MVGRSQVWGGVLNCTVRSPCSAHSSDGGAGDPRFNSASCAPPARLNSLELDQSGIVSGALLWLRCTCKPWRFGPYACAWMKDGCGGGGYFPVVDDWPPAP